MAAPASSAEGTRPALRTIEVSIALLLLLPAVVLLVVFFVLPLSVLVINSFYDYSRLTGIIPTFTLKNYNRILGDTFYLEMVGRTLRLAFLTSCVTLVIGYPIALYLTIASPRQRAWIILFILSPLLVSVIVRTFGWLIILGPNGLIHSMVASLGFDGGVVLHTETAVIAGLANVLLPFLVLSVATSLQAIDPAVPLAASSLGAGPWRVFRLITVPLSLPGIIAGLLIVFSLASSSFVTPALLGGSDYKLMSTMIYQQALILQNWPLAAAFAVVLVLVVFLVLLIQTRAIEGGRYRVVFHLIPPAAHRLLAIFALLVCVFSVAPVLVIVIESFTSTDYVVFPPPGFSLKWYSEFLKRPEFVDSVIVSTVVAFFASILATTLGTGAAIALVRYKFFGQKLLQQLFVAPLSLPGLIFGLALLQFLARYGIPRNVLTMTLAHIIITMPFAIRFITVALIGVNRNVEMAAQSLGASRWRTFRYVTLPLIRPGMVASLVFAFILSFDEVAASLFVSSPSAMTLPVRIFVYIDQNYDPLVTSVSSLLVFAALIALIIIERTLGVGRLFGLR